jgi:hypothetical protein
MVLGGFAWLAILSSFNVAAIVSAPEWVKSRALGVYMLIFNGGLALGSAGWGQLANVTGLKTTLLISAAGLGIGIIAAARYSLNHVEKANLEPSRHWPDPPVSQGLERDRGPVAVSIEYRIDPARARDFTAAATKLRAERLRDGAFDWSLLMDIGDPARRIEFFVVESWLEHLRQHERVTMADKELQDQVNAFHLGAEPPCVSHFVFTDAPEKVAIPNIQHV